MPTTPGIQEAAPRSRRPGRRRRSVTDEEVEKLLTLPGVRGVTLYQERSGVTFLDAAGKERQMTVVSVPTGDPHLEGVAAEDRGRAQIGLIYLSGQPFQ